MHFFDGYISDRYVRLAAQAAKSDPYQAGFGVAGVYSLSRSSLARTPLVDLVFTTFESVIYLYWRGILYQLFGTGLFEEVILPDRQILPDQLVALMDGPGILASIFFDFGRCGAAATPCASNSGQHPFWNCTDDDVAVSG